MNIAWKDKRKVIGKSGGLPVTRCSVSYTERGTFQKYLCIGFLLIITMVACNQNKGTQEEVKEGIKSLLITAKYCYNDYPPSYYFEGSDSIGVNIYFAGQLWNYTADTLYLPNRELKFSGKYDFPLEETLFYTQINGDSLFYNAWAMGQEIIPNGGIELSLRGYITPERPRLLAAFKNIGKDQTILDTLKICYATPNMQLENGGKLLPPITLERSKKFRIDTAGYNSYYEQIFKRSDFYENPSKKMKEEEKIENIKI